MKVLTERMMIREAAHRWDDHYPAATRSQHHADISAQLHALDLSTATANDLERIIGNRSWSQTPGCSECETDAALVVEVGQEPDYESATAWLCTDCLREALKRARRAARGTGGSAT